MKKNSPDLGFTLLEIMLVVVILSMLAFIAIPKLNTSSETAREKADITTAREVKSALDRFQIENGRYPRTADLTTDGGKVTAVGFIPEYITRLDGSVTQQMTDDSKKGFGVAGIEALSGTPSPTNIIMIYLNASGSQAEVKVYNKDLSKAIWSST